MGKRQHPEDDLQRAVAQLLDLTGWLWNHCPNGGMRGKIEAARFKGLGLKPGVPDVMIYEDWIQDGESGHGVAIELKSPKGRLTPHQKAWLAALEAKGWKTAVCRSLPEVQQVLAVVRPRRPRSAA